MSEKDESTMFWGMCFALTQLLAVLKLTGLGNYSWWFVTLPILLPTAVMAVGTVVIIFLGAAFTRRKR